MLSWIGSTGASVIARKMKDLGMEAQALEVYHDTPSLEGFDLVVSPVHLSPENLVLSEAKHRGLRIVTHHRAVGRSSLLG